jgi:hypothetical protein
MVFGLALEPASLVLQVVEEDAARLDAMSIRESGEVR